MGEWQDVKTTLNGKNKLCVTSPQIRKAERNRELAYKHEGGPLPGEINVESRAPKLRGREKGGEVGVWLLEESG